MKKLTILFLLLLAFASLTKANTYYVSATSSNNSNNGTQNSPWATLQYAANLAKPGDSIMVRSGTYVGFVMGWDGYQSGTVSKRIVFKAESGATITSKNNKTADGINLEGASYITIDGFTITNTGGSITRAGIRCVQDTGVIVRNNTIDGMGTWGILTGFSENIIIENNKSSHAGSQHGIYFGNSADHPVIRNNICFGNGGCGIHMNADSVQGGDGIITDALVEGNIIYDNGLLGGAAINMDGIQNSKVINNLLYNNHAGGISVFQIDGRQPSKNNLFYNNTVIMPANGRWAMNITSASSGNTLLNNIFLSYHNFRGGIVIDAQSLIGFKSDYNAIIDRFSADGDNTIIALAAWRTKTGQDLHSVTVSNTELFVNAASNDYHLKAACKAINTGTSTISSLVLHDLENHIRPMGTGFDIGCYEFVEGVLTYTLTVNGGSGSGSYTAGQIINITANTPGSEQTFDKWTGDITGIANNTAASTTIIMPSSNITITAAYKNAENKIDNDILEIDLYPNPVIDVLNINRQGTVSIYDLKGVLQMQNRTTNDESKIDVSILQSGIYIIKINTQGTIMTRKFIKK